MLRFMVCFLNLFLFNYLKATISDIMERGSAYLDGRLQIGDEITHVYNENVFEYKLSLVEKLIKQSTVNGYLTLGVRRRSGRGK